MREIKFRAFDKRFKTMDFGSGDLLLRINSNDFSEPMQYTGLKDKNGKEIYEGDIVRYDYNSSPIEKYKGIVEYSSRDCCYYFGGLLLEPTIRETIEVIGNIYYNPELKAD